MKRTLISVTQEHIDKGERNMACTCAVALALINHGFDPAVSKTAISIAYRGRIYDIKHPRSVNRFIKRFDKGLAVKPFRFFLNEPAH